MKAEDIFVNCNIAIKAFDSSLEDNSTTPKASVSCQRLMFFLWGAANDLLEPQNCVIATNNHIKQAHKELHEKHILPLSASVPIPSLTQPPSGCLSELLDGISFAKYRRVLESFGSFSHVLYCMMVQNSNLCCSIWGSSVYLFR